MNVNVVNSEISLFYLKTHRCRRCHCPSAFKRLLYTICISSSASSSSGSPPRQAPHRCQPLHFHLCSQCKVLKEAHHLGTSSRGRRANATIATAEALKQKTKTKKPTKKHLLLHTVLHASAHLVYGASSILQYPFPALTYPETRRQDHHPTGLLGV